MRITHGAALTAIGVLHELLALGVDPETLVAIFRDGYVAAIEPDAERMALFWFTVSGALLLLLGETMRWAERQGLALPLGLGLGLVAVGVAGGIAIPASGFWLVVAVGAHLAWTRRG